MNTQNQHKSESVEQCCTEIMAVINARLGQCQELIEDDLTKLEERFRVGTIFKALVAANIVFRLQRGNDALVR